MPDIDRPNRPARLLRLVSRATRHATPSTMRRAADRLRAVALSCPDWRERQSLLLAVRALGGAHHSADWYRN
jgi:hypothetical protein